MREKLKITLSPTPFAQKDQKATDAKSIPSTSLFQQAVSSSSHWLGKLTGSLFSKKEEKLDPSKTHKNDPKTTDPKNTPLPQQTGISSSHSSSEEQRFKLPDDWLKQLAELMFSAKKEEKLAIGKGHETATADIYLDYLHHHLGLKHKPPKLNKGLQDNLESLFLFLIDKNPEKTLSAYEKTFVKTKLLEDTFECSEGFVERVNEALISLKTPQTMDELVGSNASNVVQMAVVNAGVWEVHTRRFYFNIAAASYPFWVKDPNPTAKYGPQQPEFRDNPRPRVTEDIKKTFDKHFTLFTNLTMSRKKIEEIFTQYGYLGALPNQHSALKHYKGYENFVKYLAKLFNEPADTAEAITQLCDTYMLSDESGNLVDINWAVVEKKLWDILTTRFKITPKAYKETLDGLIQKRCVSMGEEISSEPKEQKESKEAKSQNNEDSARAQLIAAFVPTSCDDLGSFASFLRLKNDEIQPLLLEFLQNNPDALNELVDFTPFSDFPYDTARNLLLESLAKHSISVEQLQSEKFLKLVYQRTPPLLTPEEQENVIFSNFNSQGLQQLLRSSIQFNLPNLLLSLSTKPGLVVDKYRLFLNALYFKRTEIANLLLPEIKNSITPDLFLSNEFLSFAYQNKACPITPQQYEEIISKLDEKQLPEIPSISANNLRNLLKQFPNLKTTQPTLFLHAAIKARDFESVTSLLDSGADINAYWGGSTALHMAVQTSFFPEDNFFIFSLLKRGADPSLRDSRGQIALDFVPAEDDKRHYTIKLFTEYPALYQAALNGDSKNLKKLLHNGAKLPEQLDHGEHNLLSAAVRGENPVEKIKLLLEDKRIGETIKQTVNYHDNTGKTALDYAVLKGNLEVVHLLLENGADPTNGLITVVSVGNIPIMKCLLEDKRTQVNHQDPQGITPLLLAIHKLDLETVNLLLAHGANPNLALPPAGATPLDMASVLYQKTPDSSAALAILETLLRSSTQGYYKERALRDAASTGNKNMVEVLLRVNTDINSTSLFGSTALHEIAALPNFDPALVNLLLENGANPNLKYLGQTAAEIALDNGKELIPASGAKFSREFTTLLLNEKVNLKTRNRAGKTTLEVMYDKYKALPESKGDHLTFTLPEIQKKKIKAEKRLVKHIQTELDEVIAVNTGTRTRFFSNIPKLTPEELDRCIVAREYLSDSGTLPSELSFFMRGQHPFVANKIFVLEQFCKYSGLVGPIFGNPENISAPLPAPKQEAKKEVIETKSSLNAPSAFFNQNTQQDVQQDVRRDLKHTQPTASSVSTSSTVNSEPKPEPEIPADDNNPPPNTLRKPPEPSS